MKYKSLPTIALALLSGCASLSETEIVNNKKKHNVIEERKYMSCDIEYYQNSHDGSGPVYGYRYELVANKTFLYALMASNSYDSSAQFEIPGWNRFRRYKNGNGFSVDIWKNNASAEVVVAYRGTDFFQPQDWIFGNLNIFWKGQYKDAEKVIDILEQEFGSAQISTTGHSLGGGLALHSSLYGSNVNAIVFNASPRIFNSVEYVNNDNYRIVISENGEVLDKLRKKWPAFKTIDLDGPYDEFDFVYDMPHIEHGSYYIARGLTAVAASTGNNLAIDIMKNNLGCEF